MSSSRVDTILDLLSDDGQSSTETGYSGHLEDGMCWRCAVRAVAEDSDLCSGCRRFLLGDSESDPVNEPRPVPVFTESHLRDSLRYAWEGVRAYNPPPPMPTGLVEDYPWTEPNPHWVTSSRARAGSEAWFCGGPLDGTIKSVDGPVYRVVIPEPARYVPGEMIDPIGPAFKTGRYDLVRLNVYLERYHFVRLYHYAGIG